MSIMKIIDEFLNEKNPQPARLSLFQRFSEIDRSFSGDIEDFRVRIDKVNDDVALIKNHAHVKFVAALGVVLHHVCEELFHREVQNIPDFIVDCMGDREFIREVEDILQLVDRALKCAFHDLRVHVCRLFRPS